MRLRLVMAVALAALGLPLTAPARAAGPARMSVVLDTIEPRILTATGKLTLRGTLSTDRAVTGLHVALFNGPPLGSRAALHAARDQGVTDLVRAVPQVSEDVPGGRKAGPGHRAGFTVQVPVAALRLDPDQVSSLTVVLRDDQGDRGQVDTFLPYFPHTLGAPPQVSLVLPLTADPTGDPTAALGDDVGRLRTAVAAAAASRPDATHSRASSVDLAVDPALLTRTTGDVPLLDELRAAAATAGVSVQALPYADADLDALSAAGDGRGVRQRVVGGPPAVRAALDATTVADEPLLPAGGVLTARTLAESGARSVVLDGVLPADAITSTATSLTTVGRTRALVTDPELQRLITAADGAGATPRMAEQLVLAETGLIAAEAPNAQPARALVLLAPRRWAASAFFARQLVRDLAAAPWLAPTPIATMLQGPTVARTGSLPPVDTRALPAHGIDDGDGLRTQIATVGALFGGTEGAATVRRLTSYLDASESAAWRDHLDQPVALRAVVDKEVGTALGGVTVKVHRSQLLTGSQGTVTVTVTNTLRTPVTIVLRLTSDGKEGSRIKPSAGLLAHIAAAPADGPAPKQQFPLPINSRGAGRFPVTLRVETTTHVPLPASGATISIRSSNLGLVSVAITITALAVLVLALAFRGTRGIVRLRRRRRAEPGGRHRAGATAAGIP